ncbi:hypothetical protein F4803DRAFT_383852 [Xylaria telfairii]|nr:hypothetical protein F4803DRAFT_383852 [Xylaria telfairii]
MPGIVAPILPGTDYHPSTLAGPSEIDPNNISTKYRHSDSELRRVQKGSEVRLAKPLSRRKRQKIMKKSTTLIERRNRLDREVLREVEKKNPGTHDWSRRDRLLRKREILRNKEQDHLTKLAKLEELYRRDPSFGRQEDYNLVRELILKFKRHLGPLLDEYTNHRTEGDTEADKMLPLNSASKSEWTDTSDSKDKELRQVTVVSLQHSPSKRKSPKGLNSHENPGKRKREKEPTDVIPSKKVKFDPYEDMDSKPSHQKNNRNNEKIEQKKHRKGEQAFSRDVQINDK